MNRIDSYFNNLSIVCKITLIQSQQQDIVCIKEELQ